jgi:hypothetical protein
VVVWRNIRHANRRTFVSCSVCGKAKGLSGSVIEWARAGMPIATSTTLEIQEGVCLACEYYRKPICLRCGCVIAIKARLQTSKCLVGKWWPLTQAQKHELDYL